MAPKVLGAWLHWSWGKATLDPRVHAASQYKHWSASKVNLSMDDAKGDDSETDDGSEDDDEDQARSASRLGCFGAASRLGAWLHW